MVELSCHAHGKKQIAGNRSPVKGGGNAFSQKMGHGMFDGKFSIGFGFLRQKFPSSSLPLKTRHMIF
ncbi:MAG: hypothetical protein R2861_12380 [Desulfobacterales bacterium]